MMALFRDALALRLGPVAARAGFVLADQVDLGVDDGEIALLCYRREHAGRLVLLDLCQVAAHRTVTAVLWSPDSLKRVRVAGATDRVALRESTWRYDPSADLDALAAAIVSVVGAWLDHAPWMTPS